MHRARMIPSTTTTTTTTTTSVAPKRKRDFGWASSSSGPRARVLARRRLDRRDWSGQSPYPAVPCDPWLRFEEPPSLYHDGGTPSNLDAPHSTSQDIRQSRIDCVSLGSPRADHDPWLLVHCSWFWMMMMLMMMLTATRTKSDHILRSEHERTVA